MTSLGLPFLVAESADEVVGFAYAGPWKERAAYRHRGDGVGALLFDALLEECTVGGCVG